MPVAADPPPDGMPAHGLRRLVGREAELQALDVWLEDVLAGRSRPLLLDGEPGIGKTSLLRAVRARAVSRGARTLSITPIPTAVRLAHAGLSALVVPLIAEVGKADPGAVEALPPALADPTVDANPVALAGGLVALLARAAEDQPLVVVIDDGQWLDWSSAEVLLAALRGLTLDQVGLVVAVRSNEPHPFEELQRLPVGGLSRAAAAEVFASMRVDDTVLAACWSASGGNPLALDVILQDLDEAERRGAQRLPDPLPVADSIAASFRRRLEALPDATFSALVLLAVDTGSSPTALAGALAQIGGSLADLEPAEDAAIVLHAPGSRPSFAHPLLRASTLAMARPSVLRHAHGALAEAHGAAGELEARAWQLAAAAVGADAVAADALAEVATAARRRGATAVAADGFLRAAQLSPAQPQRAERLLAAGDATWAMGRVEEATHILDEALEASATASGRGHVVTLLGQIDLWNRGPRLARDRFLDAAGPLVVDDPGLATRLLGHAAFTAVVSGDVQGTMSLAQQAFDLAPADDVAAVVQATVTLGYLESHGAVAGGGARLEPFVEMADSFVDSDDGEVVGLLGLLGMCLTEAERLVEAERFLVAVVQRSRREGATATGALCAAILAETHWRRGDWLEAAHLASNDVVAGATMPINEAWAAAFLAHLDAAAGRAEACRRRAARAVRGGGASGAGVVLVWAGHAMGLLELGFGRWAEAARQLDRVAVLTESLGRHLPGAVWWQGDHIEALVRSGRQADAGRALDRLDAERSAGEQRWPASVAARGRALLSADIGTALAELDRSIELAEAIPAPFEVARSRLIRGELRRQAGGSAAEADDDLRRAVESFDRLGAAAFAERARVLLGEPVTARSASSLTDLLTPAELRVALAVARGATNREVAADLFVSAKTVEYHLQNVYRKLNLRSRTELAVRVSQASPD